MPLMSVLTARPLAPIELAATGIGLLFALALGAALLPSRPTSARLIYSTCAVICATLTALGLYVLLSTAAPGGHLPLPIGLPFARSELGMDALSAVFFVIANLTSAIVSAGAIGYGAHAAEPRRVLPFYSAFLAAMNLVLLAQDAFSFLLGWELMSLASWALVVSDDRSADNRRAGLIYLIMANAGALTLLLAFGVLATSKGGYSFEQMRAASALAPTALVLWLALIGAGSKAGLVPLHAWLPLAHPAAPSHVSALMSGVMTKIAVYGFVRIVFDLAGPPRPWWSIPVLLIAAITALLGVLQALMEHDLKRLLAYHTVENIGIIFIGLGLALAFRAAGLLIPAALALTAAIFHVFNHSLFKSLLFLGSGAILKATGERDMEHLGGLIHRMPRTAITFLVGCIAISALPPFNGFVSEWLTFQSILISPQLPLWIQRLLVPAVGATLSCSAALAAACFVKAFGISFLGRARSDAALRARETDPCSQSAMFLLATLCLLVGVLPGFVMDALARVSQLLIGAHLAPQTAQPWLRIAPIEPARGAYNGLLVFVMISVAATGAALIARRLAARATRRSPAWDCGFPQLNPSAQYTATSFAQPIRRVFGSVVFRAREHARMPAPGDTAPATLELELHDTVWEACYAPVIRAVNALADRLTTLQFLTIRNYLMLVFATLVVLLAVLGMTR